MDSVPIRIAFGVFLLWSAVAVVAVITTFALTAHEELLGQPEPTAPIVDATPTVGPSRPSGVPIDATLITDDVVIGTLAPAGEETRLFYWLTCDDQLLTVATTQETIYADVDCGRYWLVHEVVRPYQGEPVRMQIGAGPSGVLVVEATAAGVARFEADAVWVVRR